MSNLQEEYPYIDAWECQACHKYVKRTTENDEGVYLCASCKMKDYQNGGKG